MWIHGNGSVTAEIRAPALRDHEKLGRAELELCAPSAVTDPFLGMLHLIEYSFGSLPLSGLRDEAQRVAGGMVWPLALSYSAIALGMNARKSSMRRPCDG